MSQHNISNFTYTDNSLLRVILLAIILVILASCGAGRTTVPSSKTSSTLQDDIIQYGRQHLGKPYRYASKGPNSFDCSGYTSFVFRKFGYKLGSSSSGQDKQTPTISRREELQKGDLVFFEGNRKNGQVGHVGIVTEAFSNGHFKFIHSSTTSGVIISSSKEPYYASRYLRGGRVLEKNASYVTRRDPSPSKKRPARVKESMKQVIPEVAITRTEENTTTVEQSENTAKKEPVILIQTDPNKNPPLKPTDDSNEKENKIYLRMKCDIALREEEGEQPDNELK